MQAFNKWSVTSEDGKWWHCRCECGTERWVRRADVIAGRSKNCGCGRRRSAAATGKANARHGLADTATHRAWVEMRRRCSATHRKEYQNYGARGIKVCDRWQSFDNFLADMGVKPEGLTIERVDNDKGYEPSNCRWATIADQNRNKRGCKHLRDTASTEAASAARL